MMNKFNQIINWPFGPDHVGLNGVVAGLLLGLPFILLGVLLGIVDRRRRTSVTGTHRGHRRTTGHGHRETTNWLERRNLRMKYLLMTRGLYWRPDRKGYSSHVLDAGLYDEADVRSILGTDADGRLRVQHDRGDGTVDYAIPLADKHREIFEVTSTARRHVETGTTMLAEIVIRPTLEPSKS